MHSHLLVFESEMYLLSDTCDQLKGSPASDIIHQHEPLWNGVRQASLPHD